MSMLSIRAGTALLCAGCSILLVSLTACGGSSSNHRGSPAGGVTGLSTLSTAPGMVSGGDVLMEIQLSDPAAAGRVAVMLNGTDITEAFALRTDGRYTGLVTGLAEGDNTITAGEHSLTVKNHPRSGPIFSGPHLAPWVCAQPTAVTVTVTNPENDWEADTTSRISGLDQTTDEHCNAPASISYYYQPTSAASDCSFAISGANACFIPFDTANPPADTDVAEFTNDRGDTVRSIIAVETGTLNRGMYSLVVFHDPAASHHPAAPQKGWNNKLLFNFGGGAGGSRFQTPPDNPFFNEGALRRGFMLAKSSLNDHRTNSNHALAAEAVLMLKEHITEQYGEIRYTIGSGGSGGAIMQLTMASSYPGLLDGVLPTQIYADALTNSLEIFDCGILTDNYVTLPDGALTQAERLAITGHAQATQCLAWNGAFLPLGIPSLPSNCGTGFPAAITYDPVTNPQGVRCSHAEHNRNLLGRYLDNGVHITEYPQDNEGVQYGLKALQDGTIDAERFVHLNEHIGYYDADQNWVPGPGRAISSEVALENAYRSGMVTGSPHLANVPIIDVRGQEGAVDIHLNWRALALRDRLERVQGHHDNEVIWAYVGANPSNDAFLLMDTWLSAIEADDSDASQAEKVAAHKPAEAVDRCLDDGVDVGLFSDECPVKFGASPRQVAGGPVAEDILKCSLKPLDFDSADYDGITFTPDQQTRLATVFATGVCDWTRPGVQQQSTPAWMSFAEGPGGEPLDVPWVNRNL